MRASDAQEATGMNTFNIGDYHQHTKKDGATAVCVMDLIGS
jgi:hypothetical protein